MISMSPIIRFWFIITLHCHCLAFLSPSPSIKICFGYIKFLQTKIEELEDLQRKLKDELKLKRAHEDAMKKELGNIMRVFFYQK